MNRTNIASNLSKIALLIGLAGGLAACGNNQGERAVSGGLIGAGAGALIGAATAGNPLAGAAIGGAVGAAGGALIPSSTVNLGRPLWRD